MVVKKGHLLWNAGRVVSEYLEDDAARLIEGKDVLELGAGAGLPSLICAGRGARTVGTYLTWTGRGCWVDYVLTGAGGGNGLSGCASDRKPALEHLELRPVAG